jgi:general nucleoside transport system permease protein
VLVLQGIVFIVLLSSETLYGRFKVFTPERWRSILQPSGSQR